MMQLVVSLFAILVVPTQVARACEGDCITDITRAFVGNYSTPVQRVFADAAAHIARTVLPPHSATAASTLIEPLLAAYERGAYDAMEKAIFPSFFHGKCQVNGVDPAGCPNPDCPVVCGTPGSMIHFYSTLKQIAFNTTSAGLESLCSGKPFKTFEAAVLHALQRRSPHRPHSLRSTSLASRSAHRDLARRTPVLHGKYPSLLLQTRENMSDAQISARLMSVCRGTVKDLRETCGGIPGLPDCSWETAMKAFILSFP